MVQDIYLREIPYVPLAKQIALNGNRGDTVEGWATRGT